MAKTWIIFIFIVSAFGSFLTGTQVYADGFEKDNINFAFIQNLNPQERIAQIKTNIETKKQSISNLKAVSSFALNSASVKPQALASEPWRLPFVARTHAYQTQGYNGPYSHQNVKALDLDSDGGMVVAAKSGTVTTANFGGKWDGWCNSYSNCYDQGGIWRGNHVVITHSDGTSSYYLHMKPGSVQPGISAGQYIDQGTPLALQGGTGYTCNTTCTAPFSHLHFQASTNGVTVSTPFDDCNYLGNQCDSTGIPITDNAYTSTNYPPGFTENIQDKSIMSYAGYRTAHLNGINRGSTLQIDEMNQAVTSKWTWLPSGEIRGLNDWCLSASSNSNIEISDCNGQDNQKWIRSNQREIKSKTTGQCWDSALGDTNGSRIYLNSCHGGRNQQWRYGKEGYPTETFNQNQ